MESSPSWGVYERLRVSRFRIGGKVIVLRARGLETLVHRLWFSDASYGGGASPGMDDEATSLARWRRTLVRCRMGVYIVEDSPGPEVMRENLSLVRGAGF